MFKKKEEKVFPTFSPLGANWPKSLRTLFVTSSLRKFPVLGGLRRAPPYPSLVGKVVREVLSSKDDIKNLSQ